MSEAIYFYTGVRITCGWVDEGDGKSLQPETSSNPPSPGVHLDHVLHQRWPLRLLCLERVSKGHHRLQLPSVPLHHQHGSLPHLLHCNEKDFWGETLLSGLVVFCSCKPVLRARNVVLCSQGEEFERFTSGVARAEPALSIIRLLRWASRKNLLLKKDQSDF